MRYRLRVGLVYPVQGQRVERPAGAVVSDLPAVSVPWLLAQGLIEPVEDADGEVRE